MVEKLVVLCDVCEEEKSTAKCFLCGRDICDDHNFGGEGSRISIEAVVYNDHVFNFEVKDILLDCCPDCTDVLKNVAQKKEKMLEDKLKESLIDIKSWLLNEMKSGI